MGEGSGDGSGDGDEGWNSLLDRGEVPAPKRNEAVCCCVPAASAAGEPPPGTHRAKILAGHPSCPAALSSRYEGPTGP